MKLVRDFRLPPRCKSSFFWDVKQLWQVVRYRRFGTTYRSHFQGPSSSRLMKRQPIGPIFKDQAAQD